MGIENTAPEASIVWNQCVAGEGRSFGMSSRKYVDGTHLHRQLRAWAGELVIVGDASSGAFGCWAPPVATPASPTRGRTLSAHELTITIRKCSAKTGIQ
jgi:hypothetical protein